MAFIEKRLRSDATNWWAPNRACVEALLRASGFAVRARIADECWLCEAAEPADADVAGMVEDELLAATGTAGADRAMAVHCAAAGKQEDNS
jgi:tRNA (mo5U34)-methyltransferase